MKIRSGTFDVALEKVYGLLFRYQMEKDWASAERAQRMIVALEDQADRQERKSQMAENTQDLRDYEGAVR